MKPERFTAKVFLCVIMGMMMFSVLSFAVKKVNNLTEVKIDWEKLYPFEDRETHSAKPEKESLYEYVKHGLEGYTSEALLRYYSIVEVAKKYEDIVRWNMSPVFDYNAVVRLKDGYLTTYQVSLDVAPAAEAVKNFADFCAERGIDFMYINFPTKICVSEDKEISGVLDFANQNADKFLAMLTEYGVRNYDFRERLHAAGMNHHEAFYVTDHHWKAETGLWAAGEILKILRDDLSWDVKPEILRPENFEYVIYPEWFLGSQGKKVTLARVKPDNFTMIYPKFDTQLHIEIPIVNVNVSGDLTSFYDMEQVKNKDYYNLSSYHTYSYGDQALITADNKLALNTKRLLVIHDSFSDCVIPFLSLGVSHLDAIDLRHFTGSLRTFIETVKPDAVIVEYYAGRPGRYTSSSTAKKHKNLYDFKPYDFR